MNKMKKIIKILLFIFIIGIIYTIFANIYIINSTVNQIVDIDNIENKDYDAIIILGCKVNGNSPSLMLARRLDKGIEVYNKVNSKIILSGDHGKKEYDEVNVMRDYILNSDIHKEDIFLDHAGFSTYDSIYRAKHIFGAKKIIIVTQKYHLYRALYLANQLDIEAIGVVADDIPQKNIQLKNEIREILSRDKSFVMGIIKPKSKYTGDYISLNQDGEITKG